MIDNKRYKINNLIFQFHPRKEIVAEPEINIIQEHSESNVDDSKDKSQNHNNIELLQKMEDVSKASPDERPKGER